MKVVYISQMLEKKFFEMSVPFILFVNLSKLFARLIRTVINQI